jgi:hypothetical protein
MQNLSSKLPIADPLSLRELAEVLVKHYDIHEGKYDLALELQVGVGLVGPDPGSQLPGAMVSVSRIGLTRATDIRATTVDAAVVNPAKMKRKKPLEKL